MSRQSEDLVVARLHVLLYGSRVCPARHYGLPQSTLEQYGPCTLEITSVQRNEVRVRGTMCIYL